MKHKGFTVIEFLAVVAFLGIVLVVALPQLARAGAGDREAEVRSNIHAIQIALERYAVDTGGNYPLFLVGAERNSNILKCSVELIGNGVSCWPVYGMTPFAKATDRSMSIAPNNLRFLMDPLIQFGYLSGYPTNPFVRPDTGMWHSYTTSVGVSGVYPYGGFHGDVMFDLGFGWGDTPQTDFVLYMTESVEERESHDSDSGVVSDPDLDAPGNFYYHPIFADGVPVYVHYSDWYMRTMGGGFSQTAPMSSEVVGYFLYGYGAPGARDSLDEGGLDYFNRMPPMHRISERTIERYGSIEMWGMDSSVGAANQQRSEATGYPAIEYDPWTGAFPGGIDPALPSETREDLASGPDGVNDWVIIEVTAHR